MAYFKRSFNCNQFRLKILIWQLRRCVQEGLEWLKTIFRKRHVLIRLVLILFRTPKFIIWLANAQKDIVSIQKGLFILTNKYSRKRSDSQES